MDNLPLPGRSNLRSDGQVRRSHDSLCRVRTLIRRDPLQTDSRRPSEIRRLLRVRESSPLSTTPCMLMSYPQSPDGTRLAVGTQSGSVHVFDVSSGSLAATLAPHALAVRTVAWAPDSHVRHFLPFCLSLALTYSSRSFSSPGQKTVDWASTTCATRQAGKGPAASALSQDTPAGSSAPTSPPMGDTFSPGMQSSLSSPAAIRGGGLIVPTQVDG
jgi:WD40 repeat protein